ncbi:hypothetical protein ACFWFU_00375 [Streptomyces sp. NPDC060235]|uniref:hypothetical protein n=1 Tax=unclassified Streptomyces TaxID=2593676 RepID=UPI003656CCB6
MHLRLTHCTSADLRAWTGPQMRRVVERLWATAPDARTAKSKNYRRSVNVQIVCRARDRRVIAVGDAWPGNRNDIVVFRETGPGL